MHALAHGCYTVCTSEVRSHRTAGCACGSGGSIPGSKATLLCLNPRPYLQAAVPGTPRLTVSPDASAVAAAPMGTFFQLSGALLITSPSSHLSHTFHLSVPSIQHPISAPARGLGSTVPPVPKAMPGNGVHAALHPAGLRAPRPPELSSGPGSEPLSRSPGSPSPLCQPPQSSSTGHPTADSELGLRGPLLTIEAAGG